MKLSPKVQGVLWFLCVVAFLVAMFTVSFFLTGWVYHLIGQTPSALLVQIINSLLGLILAGFIITLLTRIFKEKIAAGRMQMFGPIIEALERIAKGDFSVRVDNFLESNVTDRGMISELVNTVNQVAVELNQMENMRQEFISNVSHELQSPLTSIRGFAQALQNDNLKAEDRHHYLAVIETESIRLSRLTDSLLKLASLETEHAKFEPKPYRLDKQIRNLVLACEPQWVDKAIEMELCLDEIIICADEDLIGQTWINLIHNGIKFTPVNGKISIDLRHRENWVEFKIKDTGVGISAADQTHIFERFYKADKSRTRTDIGGSGLGLSIAQKTVEMHHGTIGVESEAGIGTTFTVTLPANEIPEEKMQHVPV
ncbi:MAG: HAMP domain-containing sensor histidine kinase [Chloroflexota bacterium]